MFILFMHIHFITISGARDGNDYFFQLYGNKLIINEQLPQLCTHGAGGRLLRTSKCFKGDTAI